MLLYYLSAVKPVRLFCDLFLISCFVPMYHCPKWAEQHILVTQIIWIRIFLFACKVEYCDKNKRKYPTVVRERTWRKMVNFDCWLALCGGAAWIGPDLTPPSVQPCFPLLELTTDRTSKACSNDGPKLQRRKCCRVTANEEGSCRIIMKSINSLIFLYGIPGPYWQLCVPRSSQLTSKYYVKKSIV